MDDNAPDLTEKVGRAWTDFTGSLEEALSSLKRQARLDLILDPTTSGTGDAVYDVTIHVPDRDSIRADASSNATLPGSAQLDRRSVGQLVALGWQPPGVFDDAQDRFALSLEGAEMSKLATIVSRTMRDVFGAPHPAFLTYDYEPGDGSDDGLRLVPARPVPRPEENFDPEMDESILTDVGGTLASAVATVVAAALHTTPDDLAIDENGEISVRAGSAMVFIKPTETPAIVDVYSPLLTQVRPNERLYRELSELTRRLPIGRVYFVEDTIWASVPVYGRDFRPRHLMLAVESMTRLADELDDRLQNKFGGHRFFDTKPVVTTESDDTPPTGLYL